MKSGRGLVLSLLLIVVTPTLAHATAELDRQYALETVGFLRAWDNVDGLFGDYVANAYKEYFTKQSRFSLQDLSKGDTILTRSKVPYNKIIEDTEILGQLARAMRSESVIRTKIFKEGPKYRFTLDWLHSPKMALMASETFSLDEPRGGKILGAEELKDAIIKAVDAMVHKVPFIANVTGRDGESVTVNTGVAANLQKGDTLIVATLEEVKKHPLLHAIVDWRTATTGRLEVESVDDGIAFCRVVEEEPGRVISRYQKVVTVIPRPMLPSSKPGETLTEEDNSDAPPALGYAQLGIGVGSLSRNYSFANGGRAGGGMLLSGEAEGQLWLTNEFFLDAALAYGTAGYDQDDLSTGLPTGIPGGSVSTFGLRLDIGYNFYRGGGVFGQRAWVRAGIQTATYSMLFNSTEFQSPTGFGGPFLGLGADLPVRGRFGATLTLDFGVITSGSETGLGLVTQGASQFSIYAGGYYRVSPRMTLRAGFDLNAQSADALDSTGGVVNLTQKTVSFAPAIQFFF